MDNLSTLQIWFLLAAAEDDREEELFKSMAKKESHELVERGFIKMRPEPEDDLDYEITDAGREFITSWKE